MKREGRGLARHPSTAWDLPTSAHAQPDQSLHLQWQLPDFYGKPKRALPHLNEITSVVLRIHIRRVFVTCGEIDEVIDRSVN